MVYAWYRYDREQQTFQRATEAQDIMEALGDQLCASAAEPAFRICFPSRTHWATLPWYISHISELSEMWVSNSSSCMVSHQPSPYHGSITNLMTGSIWSSAIVFGVFTTDGMSFLLSQALSWLTFLISFSNSRLCSGTWLARDRTKLGRTSSVISRLGILDCVLDRFGFLCTFWLISGGISKSLGAEVGPS